MTIKEVSSSKSFDGYVKKLEHSSKVTRTNMKFSLFVPEGKVTGAIMWLSGLTCNEDNFITKAGAIKTASELGLALVCPDTSPRGTDFPDEHSSWDFGSSAGFYVDATVPPWNENYRMYSYIAQELPQLIEQYLKTSKLSWAISGHSMGGHGALVIGMRNSERFKSISAFAPISAPSQSPWGVKAFSNYLGDNQEEWKMYDASILLANLKINCPILVDQGTNDSFLDAELMPEVLLNASETSAADFKINMRVGYDHSYFFISSFIEDHLRFHAKHLKK